MEERSGQILEVFYIAMLRLVDGVHVGGGQERSPAS